MLDMRSEKDPELHFIFCLAIHKANGWRGRDGVGEAHQKICKYYQSYWEDTEEYFQLLKYFPKTDFLLLSQWMNHEKEEEYSYVSKV